ncbi:hypothetical protein [Tianweitania sediminis]|uniref:Uncharacterized protein n=1 Tax=Tianweitania sediminis TaxID=1502156 RepID=A0A8J7R2S9_9HYPH|nr:hypothetical protein [Tianweitania sediminis]MBP0439843.1 hypothetical protein [Tianweitania sediminis]
MIDAATQDTLVEEPVKKRSPRATKPRKSLLGKLSPEELQTLRLDDESRPQFDLVSDHFENCRAKLQAFGDEDIASMDNDRYDEHSVAQSEQHRSGMAVVHFLAPRILRLREGDAKRKWRSFLAKFRKEENLN